MNTTNRRIAGSLIIIFGLILIGISLFVEIWVLIYGIPILVVGLIIFFNDKEDNIEQVKRVKESKTKTLKGGEKKK